MLGEVKLLGILGSAAALLFAYQWQLHKAREEVRQEVQAQAAEEYRENTDELFRISARARADSARVSADAGAVRSAADRLRGAVAGSGLIIRSAAAAGGAAQPDTELLLTELQRQRGVLAERVAGLSGFADVRNSEQATCQSSYEAMRN